MGRQFEYPAGVRFRCTKCGDCCRSWNVMLGPGEEDRLRALDWSGIGPDLQEASTVVTSALPGGKRVRRLARREDGACVYLGDDDLCRIHRHFGGETKPLMCRLYPFGFYPVGERLAVDCSFACRSVSEGSGEPLANQLPEWTRLLAESSDAGEGSHLLKRGRPLSGELLWEIEHHLLEFLDDPSLPFFDRIRCCLQFVRLATSGDPTTENARTMRRAIAGSLPRQIGGMGTEEGMDKTQRAVFFQWLFLVLNPVPLNFDLLPPVRQKKEKERRLAAARAFYLNRGRPWIDNREIRIGFEDLSGIDASLLDRAEQRLLETYFRAKIVGQRFLAAGERELPLVEAVPLLFLSFPMAVWTARALAGDRGASAVEEEDLRSAVRLLDRSLGQIPIDSLPPKVRKAWRFVVEETDLVSAATHDLLTGRS